MGFRAPLTTQDRWEDQPPTWFTFASLWSCKWPSPSNQNTPHQCTAEILADGSSPTDSTNAYYSKVGVLGYGSFPSIVSDDYIYGVQFEPMFIFIYQNSYISLKKVS